jgi:hypothetical protein
VARVRRAFMVDSWNGARRSAPAGLGDEYSVLSLWCRSTAVRWS